MSKLDSSCSRMMCGSLRDGWQADRRGVQASVRAHIRIPEIRGRQIHGSPQRRSARISKHSSGRGNPHGDRSGTTVTGRQARPCTANPRQGWRAGYAEAIKPPRRDQQRGRGGCGERDPSAQRGKGRQQKGRRILVDDHQVDEVDRHPELVVLEPREQREHDDEFER